MKYLLMILFSAAAFGQGNPFSELITDFAPISQDTLQITTFSMLSRVNNTAQLNRKPLDIDYNWTKDIRRTDFYNRIGYGVRKVDIYGREFLPDAFRDATFSVLTKTAAHP